MTGGRAKLGELRSARLLRWVAPALYAVALGGYMWREGIPVGRERLLIWIVLGLLALSTANLGGWVRSVVLEWLPLALVLAVYDLLRGQADGLLFSAWYRPQLEADALLFGGTVPTVWLQDRLWDGASEVHWYDYASWAVYVSYFVATYLLAGLLWIFSRARFRRYVAAVALLAGMAFATFALFPAAPPWLASREGELDQTARLIGPISSHVPFLSFSFEGLFERGSEYANPVAAVPSLHAAYTLLFTLFLWHSARLARPLLAAYPPTMAFALVYTAEHYVVDILLGWAYTLIAVWVVRRVADRGINLRRESADDVPCSRTLEDSPPARSPTSRRRWQLLVWPSVEDLRLDVLVRRMPYLQQQVELEASLGRALRAQQRHFDFTRPDAVGDHMHPLAQEREQARYKLGVAELDLHLPQEDECPLHRQ